MKAYTAWLMVMWLNGMHQAYTPIGAYRDYDKCVEAIPTLALKLKLPQGVKVDCIDKPMVSKGDNL